MTARSVQQQLMEPIRKEQMVVVEWTDEPYIVKTQAILAKSIIDPPLEQLKDSGQVRVKMGKSTSAWVQKAIFRGPVDESMEMERTTCETNAGDEDATKDPEKAAEIKKNARGRKILASKKAGSKKKSKQNKLQLPKPKTKKVLVKQDYNNFFIVVECVGLTCICDLRLHHTAVISVSAISDFLQFCSYFSCSYLLIYRRDSAFTK